MRRGQKLGFLYPSSFAWSTAGAATAYKYWTLQMRVFNVVPCIIMLPQLPNWNCSILTQSVDAFRISQHHPAVQFYCRDAGWAERKQVARLTIMELREIVQGHIISQEEEDRFRKAWDACVANSLLQGFPQTADCRLGRQAQQIESEEHVHFLFL